MIEQEQLSSEGEEKFISFMVAGQEFCVDIMAVREIRGWTDPTRIPHSPDYVCGVINLRGTIVPIIDFAARVGMPTSPPDASKVTIVTQVGEQLTGMMVDAVSDILSLKTEAMQPIPNIASDTARSFFRGVVPGEESMIRVVDLTNVAAIQEQKLAS